MLMIIQFNDNSIDREANLQINVLIFFTLSNIFFSQRAFVIVYSELSKFLNFR